jgi:hypothetical protein
MSDREQHGLRGPVETTVTEATYCAGPQYPEWKSWYRTEYDVAGHVTATRSRDSKGSELRRFAYHASDRPLNTSLGNEGEPTAMTVHSYDVQGRLLNTTKSYAPIDLVYLRYDEHGRRKCRLHAPQITPRNGISVFSFELADRLPYVPDGGTASTIYDEHDRPTEVQVRDAQGELVIRTVRVYDAQGRVTEEKEIVESLEAIFPSMFVLEALRAKLAELPARILEASGASSREDLLVQLHVAFREQLRGQLGEQLTKLMGGQAGRVSITYSYDKRGRVNLKRRRSFDSEQTVETTYNKHGDTAAEIRQTTQVKSGKEQDPQALFSEVRHCYRYDDRGNWTEETVSRRYSPSGAFELFYTHRRTLTYY